MNCCACWEREAIGGKQEVPFCDPCLEAIEEGTLDLGHRGGGKKTPLEDRLACRAARIFRNRAIGNYKAAATAASHLRMLCVENGLRIPPYASRVKEDAV